MTSLISKADPRFKDFEATRDWSWSDNGKIYCRKDELVLSSNELYYPMITVTLKTKWYLLFLLHLPHGGRIVDGINHGHLEIYGVHFGHLEMMMPVNKSPYVDHVPNPDAVRLFARRNEFEVDELAADLIAGRWTNEVVGYLDMECDRCDGAGQIPRREIDGVVPGRCRKCRGFGVLKHNE